MLKIIEPLFIGILMILYAVSTIIGSDFWGNILSPIMCLIAFYYLYNYFYRVEKVKMLRISGLLLSLFILHWELCDTLWAILELIYHINPLKLALFDYLYPISNLYFLISLIVLAVYEFKKWNSFQFIIDSITVTISLMLLIWVIFFDKNMKNVVLLKSNAIFFISIIINFLIVSTIIIWFFSTRKRKIPLFLKASSFGGILFIILDFIYYYNIVFTSYNPNSILDLGYIISFFILAFAAILKQYEKQTEIQLEEKVAPEKGNGILLFVAPILILIFKGFELYYLLFISLVILFYFFFTNHIQKNIHKDLLLKKEKELNEQLEHKIQERTSELNYLLNMDIVTGLSNRRYFLKQLNKEISKLIDPEKIILFFMEINKYTVIKTLYGNYISEKLLEEVGKRLNDHVKNYPNSLLAVYGEDIFVYVIKGDYDYYKAQKITEILIESCSDVYKIDEYDIKITLSIGISIYPLDAHGRDELIKNADLAMSQSKKYGYNQAGVFDSTLGNLLIEKHRIDTMLKTANYDEQFLLHFQPQFSLKEERIIGFEALLRWNFNGEDMISPNKFIPVAEENGVIRSLGDWVLRAALKQLLQWNNLSDKSFKIAINISVKQLNDRKFIKTIKEEIQRFAIAPGTIEFEITENIEFEDNSEILNTLYEIKDLGILISIDDFGTGYSSLYYLKCLPIYKVKIAKSLIDRIETDLFDYTIVKMVIEVAKVRGIQVIAEGVETKEQYECLKKLNCDEIQGYYISRPIPPEEAFHRWL